VARKLVQQAQRGEVGPSHRAKSPRPRGPSVTNLAQLWTEHRPGDPVRRQLGASDLDRLAGVSIGAAGSRTTGRAVRRRRLYLALGQATFENWQSEFLQVFVFIVLTTFLVHRRSHESPDTDYDTEAALRRIEAKVDALERRLGAS
jgi:hypothetical protein